MWKEMTRAAAAASMWVMALMLMLAATSAPERLVLAGWGVLCAVAGATFTIWHLIAVERIRVETIARFVGQSKAGEGLRQVSDR